jgi:hypothetical protein
MTTIDDLVKEQKITNLLLKEILKRVDAMRNEQIVVNREAAAKRMEGMIAVGSPEWSAMMKERTEKASKQVEETRSFWKKWFVK